LIMREDLQITNRLLYQLSYVGLPSILKPVCDSCNHTGTRT
jgi:hypothetical protein